MAHVSRRLTNGYQNFRQIIEEKRLYVDKTSYLAKMIFDSDSKGWFLARPRGFGKFLTISALYRALNGDSWLFAGLDIEPRLYEESFAPRPVIWLGLNQERAASSASWLEEHLRRMTVNAAKRFDIETPSGLGAGQALHNLVTRCAEKSGQKVAVLISDCDKPLIDFMHKPDSEEAREVLRAYYSRLEGLDEHISFIFAAGITKFARERLFSELSCLRDISFDPAFSGICGFTDSEIDKYYGAILGECAQVLKEDPGALMKSLKRLYGGFCFDGEAQVYNPCSLLEFFRLKKLRDFFCQNSEDPALETSLEGKRLTSGQFAGIIVDEAFARNPGEIADVPLESYLYQAGYLSLRPGPSSGAYELAYANNEMRYFVQALRRQRIDDFYDDEDETSFGIDQLLAGLASGDADMAIFGLKDLVGRLPDGDCPSTPKPDRSGRYDESYQREGFYLDCLDDIMSDLPIDVEVEDPGPLGSTGMVIEAEIIEVSEEEEEEEEEEKSRVWVLELKLFQNRAGNKADDRLAAEAALDRIEEKGLFEKYGPEAIYVGIAVNEKKRAITAWAARKGNQTTLSICR